MLFDVEPGRVGPFDGEGQGRPAPVTGDPPVDLIDGGPPPGLRSFDLFGGLLRSTSAA